MSRASSIAVGVLCEVVAASLAGAAMFLAGDDPNIVIPCGLGAVVAFALGLGLLAYMADEPGDNRT